MRSGKNVTIAEGGCELGRYRLLLEKAVYRKNGDEILTPVDEDTGECESLFCRGSSHERKYILEVDGREMLQYLERTKGDCSGCEALGYEEITAGCDLRRMMFFGRGDGFVTIFSSEGIMFETLYGYLESEYGIAQDIGLRDKLRDAEEEEAFDTGVSMDGVEGTGDDPVAGGDENDTEALRFQAYPYVAFFARLLEKHGNA